MTYNVHACRGWDGRVSVERVAGIIRKLNPDFVALQEMDVNRRRSNHVNQPEDIARLTQMNSQFVERLRRGDERYGIAFLTRYPFKVVRAADLPVDGPPSEESTTALWVEAQVSGKTFQLITTHFKHSAAERRQHSQTLTGPDWLGNPLTRQRTIFMGDLNSLPNSLVHQTFSKILRDAVAVSGEHKSTWPSLLPLFRIDHLFLSADLTGVHLVKTFSASTFLASDHLPLVVDINI